MNKNGVDCNLNFTLCWRLNQNDNFLSFRVYIVYCGMGTTFIEKLLTVDHRSLLSHSILKFRLGDRT